MKHQGSKSKSITLPNQAEQKIVWGRTLARTEIRASGEQWHDEKGEAVKNSLLTTTKELRVGRHSMSDWGKKKGGNGENGKKKSCFKRKPREVGGTKKKA